MKFRGTRHVHAGGGESRAQMVTYRARSIAYSLVYAERYEAAGKLERAASRRQDAASSMADARLFNQVPTQPQIEAAMDALRTKIEREEREEAVPNRARRPRVYDAAEIAQSYHDTFADRPWTYRDEFGWEWPPVLQHVGDSLGICYESDKWSSTGDWELYKHLAESRHRCLCVPGFLRDYDSPEKRMPSIGPLVSFANVVMPDAFAILARFEEIDLKLHVAGTSERPRFGKGDEGHVAVTVAHAHLAASKLRRGRVVEPFLCVYTAHDGPLLLVVGKQLDVEHDGITG